MYYLSIAVCMIIDDSAEASTTRNMYITCYVAPSLMSRFKGVSVYTVARA
jgi:hypothetical protein